MIVRLRPLVAIAGIVTAVAAVLLVIHPGGATAQSPTTVRVDNNTPVAIPPCDPARCLPSEIASSRVTLPDDVKMLPVQKVTVSLHIAFPDDGDLQVWLRKDLGELVNLSLFNGGSGDNFGTSCAEGSRTVFDQSAATPIADGTAPFVGIFRPDDSLDFFNNQPAEGTWKLQIANFSENPGTLLCWSLIVELGSGPTPAVTSVTPTSGPYFGGTTVTITGTNLTSPTGPTTIAFGAAPATGVSCSSATSCTATSPPGTGTVDIRVTVGGQSSVDTPADDFTYLSPDGTAMTLSGRVPAGSGGTLRALVPTGSTATAGPPTPAQVAGTELALWRDGSLGIAAGTLAQAAPAGTVCGQVTVAADGSFTMPVFAASQIPGCGTAGTPLAFTLNDQPLAAASPVTFAPGATRDLGTLISGPSPTPTPSSTPSPVPSPTPTPMTVTAQVWRQLPPIVSENQTEGTIVPVVGGVVEALVDGTVCGQGLTDGQGRVHLTVAADPPAAGCGRPGRALSFRVNGAAAASDPLTFRSGSQAAVTLILPGPMPPPRR